jgi:MATE family multidrug resistance protein
MGPLAGSNDSMGFTHKNERIDSSASSILRVVIPLILSALSENLMFLIDRIALAYYSVNAMNAAMFGGSLAALYTFSLMSIAGTTEIFVGQYNGAQKYHKIGSPVWQMIYFTAISLLFIVPIGWFANALNLIPNYCAKDGVVYQKILTYFCWVPALTSAFTGFFVGRGKTKIVTVVVLIGTLVNIALDYLLIFGCGNTIPSMGCKGAAIATVVAESVQMIILGCVFWSKQNRKKYNTATDSAFDKKIFFGCVKVGFPMAIGRCVEMLAWYLVLAAMGHASMELGTVQGIVTTVYVLFAFVCDGLIKGSATLSSNFIGQKDLQSIMCVFKKLTVITLLICSIVMLPLLSPHIIFKLLNALHDDISSLYPQMEIIFKMMFVEITADSLCCISCGILMSGGDSKYPIAVNIACTWGIVVAPVAVLFSIKQLHSAVVVNLFPTISCVVCLVIIYRRYRSLKWYKSLID